MKKTNLLVILILFISSSTLLAQDHPFTSFGLGMDGVVTSITTDSNGNFYFGGISSVAGTTDIQNIVKYDGENWIDIGRTAFFLTFVRDMEVAGDYLYLAFQRHTSVSNEIITPGGATVSVNSGLGAYHIPTETWIEVELPDDLSFNFSSLASDGSTAYAGSSRIFRLVNGVADYVAPGKPYTGWSLGGGTIHALEYHDGKLYVGGRFSRLYDNDEVEDPSLEVRHVAIFNLGTNSWEAMGEGFSPRVYSIHITDEGKIYAGGGMDEILDGENTIITNGFAKWDGVGNWEPVGQGIDLSSNANRIESIASEGEDVFVAGRFEYVLQADGTEVETGNFAVWDGQQWVLDEYGNSQTGSGVNREINESNSENISSFINTSNQILQDMAYKIHNHNGEIYLGGSFDRMRTGPDLMNKVNARNIVSYDRGEYYAIGEGVDDIIFDVVQAGEDYYLTGTFVYGYNNSEKVQLNGIARYNTSEELIEPLGQGLDECLNMGPGFRQCSSYGSHLVFDEDSGELYVSGRFMGGYQSDGSYVESPMALRWDGTSWQAMGNGLTPDFDMMDTSEPNTDNRWIFDMQQEERNIYFAGAFTEIDDGNVDGRLAAVWDIENGSWQGIPMPENYDVPSLRSITRTNESIYFGARLPDPRNVERFPVVKYDQTSGISERLNFAHRLSSETRVNNIIKDGDFLYILSNGISAVTVDENGEDSESFSGTTFIYDTVNDLWTTNTGLNQSHRVIKRENTLYVLNNPNSAVHQASTGTKFLAYHLGTEAEVVEDEIRGGLFGASEMEDSVLLTGSFIDRSSDDETFVRRSAKLRTLEDQRSGAIPVLFKNEIQNIVFTEDSETSFELPVGNLGNESFSGTFIAEYQDGADWLSFSDVTLDGARSGTANYQVSSGNLLPGTYRAVITLNPENPDVESVSANLEIVVDPLRIAGNPSPENGAVSVPIDTDLKWSVDEDTETVQILFSEDVSSIEDQVLYDGSVITELSSLPDLSYNTTYYWQVNSETEHETTEGDIWSFTTESESGGLITLLSPENESIDLETELDFSWSSYESAESYNLQVATDNQFDNLHSDLTGLTDTTYTATDLEENSTYFWRVEAVVDEDDSGWTEIWTFSTALQTTITEANDIPKQSFIDQNYPNPFNPVTTIQYGVSEVVEVSLEVYNLLGRQVAVLVQESKNPGSYMVKFNASSLSSGIYFYRIQAGDFIETRKLTLIK